MPDFRFGNYDFSGPPHIPVYVMLPLDTINDRNEVNNRDWLIAQLQTLQGAGVEGVMVDCWWGRVQGKEHEKYEWKGYKDLFSIVQETRLKIKAVMSFHKCVGDTVTIPLPEWVTSIGDTDSDIYYKDLSGRIDDEYLSLGTDNKSVLKGNTALQVYKRYMQDFKNHVYNDYSGIITGIEVGLGPAGELRYPSYQKLKGWIYPNIGEFQCDDRYMKENLATVGQAPQGVGTYNSKPQETLFFRDGGGYSTDDGKSFLAWYSGKLIEHGDNVMQKAREVFDRVEISAKVPGIYWWYDTKSHAAEATAGLFTGDGNSVYSSIAKMLAKHSAILNYTCVEMRNYLKIRDDAYCDPEGLFTEVLKAAHDCTVPTAYENADVCDQDAFLQILKNTKLNMLGDNRRDVKFFTYLRSGVDLMGKLEDFTHFVSCMRGMCKLTKGGC